MTLFHFSRLHLHLPDFFWAGKLLRKFQDFFNNSRICTNPKNDFAFFQTLAHLFLFDEKVKCR